MNSRIEENENQLILHLEGDLDIEASETLKQILLQAVLQSKNVVVNLDKASQVSLSTLQLLCAAHRTALMKEKDLSVHSRPAVFWDTVRMAGYGRHQGCTYDRYNRCLWLEENSHE